MLCGGPQLIEVCSGQPRGRSPKHEGPGRVLRWTLCLAGKNCAGNVENAKHARGRVC